MESPMTTHPMDGIRMALDREKSAYRICTECSRDATGPAIRDLFRFLAEEEKHVKLLQDEIGRETLQET
jgi:rubrerythrin